MKNIKLKEILIPTITLFVICIIVSALLAGTNALTKEPIAKNAELKSQQAMQSVCPDAVSFELVERLDKEAYLAIDANGKAVGCAVSLVAKGYGGDVSVMVGISKEEGGMVTGVEILSHDETPGLGANATGEDFRSDYKQAVPENGFSVTKDGTGGENGKIDAITGATITSSAVTNAVNEAVEIYNTLVAGGEL